MWTCCACHEQRQRVVCFAHCKKEIHPNKVPESGAKDPIGHVWGYCHARLYSAGSPCRRQIISVSCTQSLVGRVWSLLQCRAKFPDPQHLLRLKQKVTKHIFLEEYMHLIAIFFFCKLLIKTLRTMTNN